MLAATSKRYLPWLLVLQAILAFAYFVSLHNYPRRGLFEGAELRKQGSRKGALWVRAVVSDTGGWNAIKPVVSYALAEGARVDAHFSGACEKLIRAGKLDVGDDRIAVFLPPSASPGRRQEAPLEDYVRAPHHVTLVAASASVEGTAASVTAMCTSAASKSISLVEDRYATALNTLAGFAETCAGRAAEAAEEESGRPQPGRPSYAMMVADSIALDLVRNHSPYRGRVVVTGAPMFDHGVREQRRAARGGGATPLARQRATIRQQLGIASEDTVVLVAGQPVGTGEVIRIVAGALVEVVGARGRGKMLIRNHPRQTPQDREEAAAAIRATPRAYLSVPETLLARFPSSEALLPAVDVVISGYSTTNYYGIVSGLAGVVYARTGTFKEKFLKDKKMEQVPEVAAGAGWEVASAGDLAHVLRQLAGGVGRAGAEEVQKLLAQQAALCKFHDGLAGERVWKLARGG